MSCGESYSVILIVFCLAAKTLLCQKELSEKGKQALVGVSYRKELLSWGTKKSVGWKNKHGYIDVQFARKSIMSAQWWGSLVHT